MLKAIKIFLLGTNEQRVEKLESEINNIEDVVIGSDLWKSPLGTGFDIYESQEDFDDFMRSEIERKKKKILKLKETTHV